MIERRMTHNHRGAAFPEIKDEEKQLIKRVVQGYDLKSCDVRALMTRYSEAQADKKKDAGKKAKRFRRK